MSDSKKQTGAPAANPLWGGRFAEGPAAIMEEINASVAFDHRLAHYAGDKLIKGSDFSPERRTSS